MRSVAHSTRTTILIATILAAAASLLLALTAPFMGTAHADAHADSFIVFTNVEDGHPGNGDKTEPISFRVDHGHVKGDLSLNGFPYTNEEDKIHVSCSNDSPLGATASTTDDHPWGAGIEVRVESLGDFFIFRNHVSEQGNNTCGTGTLPGGDDDQPDPTASLTLIKVVQGGNGSISDFTPVVTSGDDTLDFSFGSQEDAEATDVEPGTYTLGEQADEDYDLAGIVCDNDTATGEGEQTLDVTLEEGDEVTCTFTNVFSTIDDDDDIIDEDDDLRDDDIIDTVVLDDVITSDDDTTGGAADDTDVKAGTDVLDAADELPATGLETIHLALLAALLAALGILFLLGTETDKVRVHRA